jgi:hypothetical protein
LPALEAVLAHVPDHDVVWNLGDVVDCGSTGRFGSTTPGSNSPSKVLYQCLQEKRRTLGDFPGPIRRMSELEMCTFMVAVVTNKVQVDGMSALPNNVANITEI